MKKLLSALLCAILCVSLLLPAAAALDNTAKNLLNAASLTPLYTGYSPLDQMIRNIFSSRFSAGASTYDKIKAFVKQAFDAEAEIDVKIDPSLIGGFILDIENNRMDASVAGQLNALKNRLKQ